MIIEPARILHGCRLSVVSCLRLVAQLDRHRETARTTPTNVVGSRLSVVCESSRYGSVIDVELGVAILTFSRDGPDNRQRTTSGDE
jgi:hypothetical protein